MRALLLACGALAASLSACFPSNVVAPVERMVTLDSDLVAWRPAERADVPGLYSSTEIAGPMAASLWKLHYFFDAGGAYTGAALFAGSPPHFEVLSGTWSFTDGKLQLDDAEPAVLEAAPRLLRLSGVEGSVVLARDEG